MVRDLEDQGAINNGVTRSLINKINIAKAMLEDAKPGPAANVLGAFVQEREALLSNGTFTSAQADPIIEFANEVISLLTT